MSQSSIISKKKKFIKKGVFRAELYNYLHKELAEDGFTGVAVHHTPRKLEVIISATRPQNVLGGQGRRIRELKLLIQKRFKFAEGTMDLFVEKEPNRGLSAVAMAESLRYKLVGGLNVRRAANGVIRFIMEAGAQGVEIMVSGKTKGLRAKCQKFTDGLMIHSGDPTNHFIVQAVQHVSLRQGSIGLKVKIMLPFDPTGKNGCSIRQPDHVEVKEAKPSTEIVPRSETMQWCLAPKQPSVLELTMDSE